MATMQDIGGLLFGQGGTGLEEYLTAAQQKQMQQQGLMSAAAALLAASGERPVGQGVTIGQALGGALQAGQQGYMQAQQGAIQTLMARQKLAEAKRQEDFRKALQASQVSPQETGAGGVTTITPDQAIAMGGMPFGPTVQRAAMIGQEVQKPKMSQQDILYQDAINNYNIAKRYGYPEIASKYLDDALKIKPREEVTGDIFKSAGGEYVQRTKSGQFIPVSSQFAPVEKPVGAPIKVTDSQGKQVLVNMMSDGTYKTVEGFGPARELVQVDRGGVITFVDKDKVAAGTNLGKTLAPQVVGGAETGYYAIGGGGGGGVTPAPIGGQPPAVANPPLGSTIMRPNYTPAPSAPAGQVIPPSGAAPVAGGLTPLIAGTGPKPTESYFKSALGIQNTNDAINNFTTALEGFKTSDMFSPEKRAVLGSAHSNAMLQAKELYNLGVLTGGDEVILNKVLSNPVDFTTAATPIASIRKQAEDLQKIIKGANANLARVYKQQEIPLNKPPEKPAETGLQEGQTGTSKSGKPMIVRNGKWVYQ